MSANWLLDVNVLLALGWAEHEAHEAVVERLSGRARWATCAITQLGFVRISSTAGVFSVTTTPAQAQQALAQLCADKQHRFLADMPDVLGMDLSGLQGPKQTTDAYLIHLAQHHGMKLLTLDRRLMNSFPKALAQLVENPL